MVMFGYCFKIDFIFLSSTYASLKVYQWLQIGHSKHKLFKHLLRTHFYSLFWSLWKWKLSSLNTQSYCRMRWILGFKYIRNHFHARNYWLKLYFQAYKEEIFGPVLCVLSVDTLEEAIQLINNNMLLHSNITGKHV